MMQPPAQLGTETNAWQLWNLDAKEALNLSLRIQYVLFGTSLGYLFAVSESIREAAVYKKVCVSALYFTLAISALANEILSSKFGTILKIWHKRWE